MKIAVLLAFSTAVAVAGCKKTADPAARGSAAPATPAASKSAPAAEVDRVEVLARHRPIAGKEDLDADRVLTLEAK